MQQLKYNLKEVVKVNFTIQSKRIRPNAKCHSWCKNYYKCFIDNLCCGVDLTHKQRLKVIRENDLRYCKNYRFSKKNFNEWKKFRKDNKLLKEVNQ